MKKSTKSLIYSQIFLVGSLLLYHTERRLAMDKTHFVDVNNDEVKDRVNEIGYSGIFSRYEVYVNQGEGIFVRDKRFSKEEIASKLGKN